MLTYFLIVGAGMAIVFAIFVLVIKWFVSKGTKEYKHPSKDSQDASRWDGTWSLPSSEDGVLYRRKRGSDFPDADEMPEADNYEMFDPLPASESVEFAIFAPRSITPHSSFVLDVWAYLPNQYASIATIAQELGRDANLGRKTGVPIPRGAILTVAVHIDRLKIEDPIDTVVWNSEPTNASFIVKVPADRAIGQYSGKATIKHQGIAIAKIVFLISVDTAEARDYVDHSAETVYPKSAFASYASANRAEVLARIQGMKKVAPELDVFLDIFSLRSGQNWQQKLEQHVPTKDTFYLFWSEPAARSEWVEREWRLALSERGLDYIDPVPLEEPDLIPPPQELKALHFSDAYLAYIKYQRIKKQLQT